MERDLTPSRSRALRVVGFLLLWGAHAARAATLTYVPADTSVTLGDHVVLRAVLDAQPDVKGASLAFGWTPSRLSLSSVHAGDVFTSAPSFTEFTLGDVVAPADSASFDAAALIGSGHGPGVVAFLDFQATALGIAFVDCHGVDLRDSHNNETLPPCTQSIIRILGPVPTRHTRWGELKARYR